MRIIDSPYNLKESIGIGLRNVFGISKKNPGQLNFLAHHCELNSISKKYTIACIGDIMSVGQAGLTFSEKIRDFFNGTDYLIGNFEGIITKFPRHGLQQKHNEAILDCLAELFPSDKTFFTIANNHACDFGSNACSASIQILSNKGYHIFGLEDTPFCDITNDLRVIGGTMWSNKPNQNITQFEAGIQYMKKKAFNLFFPHWGYELEIYPRIEIIQKAQELLEKFDVIIGHHSHVPQPISSNQIGQLNKLVAYSLGDFSTNIKIKHYHYGEIVKLEIGLTEMGSWAIGNVDWSFTQCVAIEKAKNAIEFLNTCPFFE